MRKAITWFACLCLLALAGVTIYGIATDCPETATYVKCTED